MARMQRNACLWWRGQWGCEENGTTILEKFDISLKISRSNYHITQKPQSWVFILEKWKCTLTQNLCTNVFMAALFVIAKNRKQPKCRSRGEQFKSCGVSCPGWCGSVDRALACGPKGHQFNFQSGHVSGLQARSPVGGVQKAAIHGCFSPSLSPSLLLFLKINK